MTVGKAMSKDLFDPSDEKATRENERLKCYMTCHEGASATSYVPPGE